MIEKKEQDFIKDAIFSLVNFCSEVEVLVEDFCGVRVCFDGKTAKIGCRDKTTFARAMFILAKNAKKGSFSVEEKPAFETLGIMLDCSRNAVMKPSAVKKYIEYMAALGFNRLMLYTEDTYKMEKYPYFGYMRGGYSVEELKGIDDYAYSFGIEVIPCIQTLGHMEQYLKHKEALPIRDTFQCMLVGADETYEFIEESLKTFRSALRSHTINICMDETWDLGLGNYLLKNDYKTKADIILEHIPRVFDLCRRYDYKPMMYSDMLFRLGTGGYYIPDAKIPKEYQDFIPEDMTLIYWDYYKKDKGMYDNLIDCHRDFERSVVFMGGLWTWESFVEDTLKTLETSVPALLSCIDKGVKDVFVALWGDDGTETCLFRSVSTLSLFSEMCYKGRECSISELDEVSGFLTGVTLSDKLELSKIHSGFHQDKHFASRILYSDILYDLTNQDYDYDETMKCFEAVVDYTEGKRNDYFEYCNIFAKSVMEKCRLLNEIPRAYKSGDKAELKKICEEDLPLLIEKYEAFLEAFTKEWKRFSKPFGLETITNRIGGVVYRMKYAKDTLDEYCRGDKEVVEELEEKRLPGENPYTQVYTQTVVPSFIV